MLKTFFKTKPLPTVAFATCVWEKDWRQILLDPEYLPVFQIQNHCFPFAEKFVVINNVKDLTEVKKAGDAVVRTGVLSHYVVAEEKILEFFHLERRDFKIGSDANQYENVTPDWIYYNALGPLSAIYHCKSDYLLYLTGDVRLDGPAQWIPPSLRAMEKNPHYKVANPVWNGKKDEAKKESYCKKGPFYIAKEGFSDQLFLVKTEIFQQPIYGEIREDSAHFPRGDVFEKRVFSYMKNRGWERIIYRHASYTHENFQWDHLLEKV